MAIEGRRAFVSQLGAGAGLIVLGACSGPAAPTTAPIASASQAPSAPPRALAGPAIIASLQGGLLALRYRYGEEIAGRFAGPPWAATLIVSVHPASASTECTNLAKAAQRAQDPVAREGLFEASAEVDLRALFGLQDPFVRYIHASFLHLRSDVLRIASA